MMTRLPLPTRPHDAAVMWSVGAQRVIATKQAMRKKYKIKEAMERMRATNNYHGLDALL